MNSKRTNKSIYAIPGLGLDGRIYDGLQFDNYEIIALSYIDPYKDETLDSYVDRMLSQLPDSDEPVLLMGHSFGGIIAQEIAHKRPVEKLILISTMMSHGELPPHLALLRKFPAYDLIKKEIIKKTYFIWGEQDGYNNHEERKIFMEMTDKLSDYYYKWAVKNVVQWEASSTTTVPFLRIHGSRDLTFPIRFIKGEVIKVKGGTHVVLKSQSKVVSAHINIFLGEPVRAKTSHLSQNLNQ